MLFIEVDAVSKVTYFLANLSGLILDLFDIIIKFAFKKDSLMLAFLTHSLSRQHSTMACFPQQRQFGSNF